MTAPAVSLDQALHRLWGQARLARHALVGMMNSPGQITADDLDLLHALLLDVDQRITALRESTAGHVLVSTERLPSGD